MDKNKTLISATVAAMLAAGLAVPAQADAGKVKCYGVAKAGANACASADGSHSCAGQAAKDKDPNEWVYVESAASCNSQGGSLQPAAKK